VCPGHFWLLKFGKVDGSNSYVEKKFKLVVWIHRVHEDSSGLTFDTDALEAPVAMIVNSSELCVAGFDLKQVIPLQLEVAVRGDRCTSGVFLKQIHGMGTRRYVLSVDNDNEFRLRCE
jgi:hypothetical protein